MSEQQFADKTKLKKHIVKVANSYLCDRNTKDIYLNVWLLGAAIDSAIIGLERMASFHLPHDKKPDRHKYAGFLSRWIAKFSPIQFKEELLLNQTSDNLIWVNSEFSVYVFFSFLKADILNISNNLLEFLKYSCQFRDEKGESLAAIAYCCENIGNNT